MYRTITHRWINGVYKTKPGDRRMTDIDRHKFDYMIFFSIPFILPPTVSQCTLFIYIFFTSFTLPSFPLYFSSSYSLPPFRILYLIFSLFFFSLRYFSFTLSFAFPSSFHSLSLTSFSISLLPPLPFPSSFPLFLPHRIFLPTALSLFLAPPLFLSLTLFPPL